MGANKVTPSGIIASSENIGSEAIKSYIELDAEDNKGVH